MNVCCVRHCERACGRASEEVVGPHLLRVPVISGAGLSEQSATIDGELASGAVKALRILFNDSDEMNVSPQ